jgi:hypothetical protein
MKHYRISNETTGLELGVYEGETQQEALDAMARDAGYADHAQATLVAGDTGIMVEEVFPVAVTVRQGWESLVYGSDKENLAQIDKERTKQEFAKQICKAVEEEFPGCEIDIEVTDEDPTYGVTSNNRYVSARVGEICEDVFDMQMFWVDKQGVGA